MENYLSANLSNLTNNASNVIDGTGNGDDNGGDNTDDPDPEPEVCETPQSSTVEELSESSVLIDWTDIPSRIRYRKVGTRRWTAKNSTTSERTITGLDSDVVYEYQLRTRCPGGWTRFGAKQTFTIQSGTDDDGDSGNIGFYTLKITLDDYVSQMTWFIFDENYSTIYSGGPYQDGQAGKVITESIDLVASCYELELQDAYGDGICCDYGDGSAEIPNANGQQVVELDGQFGTFHYVGFCVDGNGLRVKICKRDSKKKNLRKK